MSDTRIGRTSISTQHGLSRFGRRSLRRDAHAGHVAHAGAVLGPDAVELTDLAAPADHLTAPAPTADGALPVTLDLPVDHPALRAVVTTEDAADPSAPATIQTRVPFTGDAQVEAAAFAPPAPRRAPAFALPVGAGLGLAAALVTGAPVLPLLAVAVVWLLVGLQQSASRLLPGAAAWQGLLPAATAAVATAGTAVGVLTAPRDLVGATLLLVAVGSLSALALRRARRIPRRRIVVVGGGAEIAAATARWLGHGDVQVVGALRTDADEHDSLVSDIHVPVAHDATDLGAVIDSTGADLVVVCGPADEATLRRTAWEVESRPVALALAGPFDSVSPHRLQATRFAGTTLTHVAPSRPTALGLVAKSALDRVAALALLAAFSPVIVALAVWIRVDSPGPVFFRQTRVGHRGATFTMWKLRTMVTDAERIKAALDEHNEGAGLLFKMQHDPRITKAGRVLRKLSLDELPQLINVAFGHMSLVGPRPALPAEVARYDAVTRRRLASKPGITGLWQVSGRSDLSWDESVRLDLHYTDNWRIRDDAAILFRTAGAVLNSRGAY